MFLKLRPLLFSLVFLFGLEFLAFKQEYVFFVLGFLFILSFFEGRIVGKRWMFSVLPIFFTVSSTALLYLVSVPFEEQVFILLSSFLYYLSLLGAFRLGQYKEDKTARGMNMAATAATIFFTYSSFYGLYLNFLVPLWVLMLAYVLTTVLVTYQYLRIINPKGEKIIWVYSLLIALVMAEIIWTMNYWPFGYLTTGTVALILYYVLWDITQSFFLELLSRKRVVANAIFFSVLIILILLTSKWIPVI